MYKKFTQKAIDDVKDNILSGNFNYYYGGDGSDLDDETYMPDFYEEDDDDWDVDYDFIDIEDYVKYRLLYDVYYLAESVDKRYNIVDSVRMATLLETDVTYVKKIGNSGLVVLGNEFIPQQAVDFRVTKPNYLYDLDSLSYPVGYDWFVVNRISPNILLLSDNDNFVLYDVTMRTPVSKPYSTIQKIIDNVFVSAKDTGDKVEYDIVDVANKHLINLSEICSLDDLVEVVVSSESLFHVIDDKGNKYEIKLDEGKNYKINKV